MGLDEKTEGATSCGHPFEKLCALRICLQNVAIALGCYAYVCSASRDRLSSLDVILHKISLKNNIIDAGNVYNFNTRLSDRSI